jgi:hypothetical protein
LTFYTALRPRGERSGSVPSGRNGYRYSCSATGLWHSYGPIGGQNRAKAGHLPAHTPMVCLESLACVFNGSDHAGTVRSFPGILYHFIWRDKCDDHGAGSSRAAGEVEWAAWSLCGIGDYSCADRWRAHLEGTRPFIRLSHSHSSGSPFASAFIVHSTGDSPRAKPWGDEGGLNSAEVPAAYGDNRGLRKLDSFEKEA